MNHLWYVPVPPLPLQDVRYGVISYENLVRDLDLWETMLVSTMMQRPIKTIVKNDEIWQHQMKNLKSALALGALRTMDGEVESKLYENIVSIPHYHQKQMHSLVDKEDEEAVVRENYAKFKQMYHPIWQTEFKDCFNLTEDGKFEINHDHATRKYLMSHVNDNVFQNINAKLLSALSYD